MKNAKKNGFSKFIAVVLAILSIVMPTIGVYADEFIEPRGQAAGIQNGASYMIKNAVSNKYLTLPGYFDVEDDGKNNVYQSYAKVNDQYSRAVTVSYSNAEEKYNLSPLLFQGIITGGLKNDGSGNVVFGKTTSAEYNWSIEKVNATQYRVYCGGLALTSYGVLTGNVNTTGVEVSGNIYLTAIDKNSQFQLWTFESVTVNPHMLKNDDVTKKNLGTGAEWLFQLGSGEMGSNSSVKINSVDFSNTSIVRSEIIGEKRVIVKFNGDASPNNDRSDDYTVMTFNLKKDQETFVRIAVIQDAGTGQGDACLTLPFEKQKNFWRVTIDEGACPDYILTFKSTLGNVKIKNWELVNEVGDIDFSEEQGRMLTGENFAIVNLSVCGFVTVKATTEAGSIYTMVIDVSQAVNNITYSSPNSIGLSGNMELSLWGEETYLIHFQNIFSKIKSVNVQAGNIDIIQSDDDYVLLRTPNYVEDTVLQIVVEAKESSVSSETTYNITIEEIEYLSPVVGECYTMHFAGEEGMYIAAYENDDEPRVGNYMLDITPGVYWRIASQGNNRYIICSMDMTTMEENGRALGFKDGEIVHLEKTSANLEYLLWEIDMDKNWATGVANAIISPYLCSDRYLCLKELTSGEYIVTLDDEAHTWYLEEQTFDAYHAGWYTGLHKNEDGKYVMYYYVDESSIESVMGNKNGSDFIKLAIEKAIELWNLDKVGISLVRVNSPQQFAHITIKMDYDTSYNFVGQVVSLDDRGYEIDERYEDCYRTEFWLYKVSSRESEAIFDIGDYIVSDPSMIIGIIAHELGHAFKLSHNMDNTSCSVMRDNMGHELYLESPTYYDLFTLMAKVRSEI